MGYSDDPSMVRVDFFKNSGKWYTTEAVKWTGSYTDGLIHSEFAKSLHDHLFSEKEKQYRLRDMVAICLEPYHEYSHPISLEVNKIIDYL